jgi:hypothetical protein
MQASNQSAITKPEFDQQGFNFLRMQGELQINIGWDSY